MYSDVDIQQAMSDPDKGLSLDPYNEDCLSPVGYDLRVGEEAFSWKSKKIVNIQQQGKLEIEAGDTVVIKTLEKITLSKSISGTIHSMVSKSVIQGLSHISTTVDPDWKGSLLVTVHNHLDTSTELKFKEEFCTICFYQVKTESVVNLPREIDRKDLWKQLDREKILADRKEKQEERDRLGRNAGIATVIAVAGIGLCILFPERGSAVATLIAAFSPLIYSFFTTGNKK